ncbi:MAG: hypothetical protein WKF91_15425 [Segetibacter sp.]
MEDIGTADNNRPSLGEITSRLRCEWEATKLPAIKFWTGGYIIQSLICMQQFTLFYKYKFEETGFLSAPTHRNA